MNVQILVFDGFDELDALAPFEVLQNARALGADLQTELVTLDGAHECLGSHSLRIRVDGRLTAENPPDILVVPGGGWNDRAPQGTWAEAQRGDVPRAINEVHGMGTTVAAVCTGGMLLASAGITAGRPATTHQGALEELRASGAQVVDARVVDDGDVITAGGVTSGLDLGLWLVERFVGVREKEMLEREMEFERRGPVWRRA